MSKEPKDERFIRLAEARVNKIIKMVRLLGNLSGSSNYSYTDSQVEQIYDALQTELDKSRKRFTAAKTGKKRFSLSDSYEPDTPQERYPTIECWDEVGTLTDEQYQALIADKTIPDRIHSALGKNDGYYESYWESVSEVAHTVVNEHIARYTHSSAESADKKE